VTPAATAPSLIEGEIKTEPGLTMSWGMTPNLTVNAALNPDFSQVEADAPQLEVNTTFTLSYPEKRPFFLEGADFFETPLRAVYTRAISDPDWGGKLTGKEGSGGGGAFVTRDAITNVVIPGPEQSSLITIEGTNIAGVARYRHDVGKNSTVGLLLTSRTGDDYSNNVGGVDTLLRFSESDSVSAQMLYSSTSYPGSVTARFDQPEGTFDGAAGRIRYRHSTNEWFWTAAYDDVGTGFRADAGFIPRVDYRYGEAGLQRTWRGDEKNWYTRLFWGGDWDRTENQNGFLLEQEVETWFGFAGPLQSFVEFDIGGRTSSYQGRAFPDQQFVNIYGEFTPHKRLYVELQLNSGDTVDFVNVRPATRLRIAPFLRYRATRNLQIDLSHQREELDVDEGRLFTAAVSQLRAVYQFNLRTFLRAIVQHSDVERNEELYLLPVSGRSQRIFPELLFSYTLNPQTVLFVGYSSTRQSPEPRIDLQETDRTFFVKIGYAWLM
jgi:hypothetical protein